MACGNRDRRLLCVLSLASFLSCASAAEHGSGQNQGGASGATDGSRSGPTDGGSSSGWTSGETGGAVIGCPAQEPTEGDPCPTAPSFSCWYGDSPRPECRDSWFCVSQKWQSARQGCAPLTDYCPAQQPDASTCSAIGDPNATGNCAYSGGVLCRCPCTGTPENTCAPSQWVCYGPPTTPGCPQVLPNQGTPCSVQGTQCSYGNPCDGYGVGVYCRAGFWDHSQIACPGAAP